MTHATNEAIRRQDESDAASARMQDMRRRSGHDDRRPSSATLAHRFIEAALHVADHVPGTNDRSQAALGLISAKLAIAGENNNWVREWLAKETESLNERLRERLQEQEHRE